LKEALKEQDVHLDGSNSHMFDDKKARHDAMNSLASFSFQMHEIESQKEDGSTEVAQQFYQEGMQLSNEMSRYMIDI
jgi:hypothetical protein